MTTETTTYRVTAALVQLFSETPNSGMEKHFYQGQNLPNWVAVDEVERLLSVGAIEEIVP